MATREYRYYIFGTVHFIYTNCFYTYRNLTTGKQNVVWIVTIVKDVLLAKRWVLRLTHPAGYDPVAPRTKIKDAIITCGVL